MNTSDNVTSAVRIRPFRLADVEAMQRWTRHTDPLFATYNVPKLTSEQSRAFFDRIAGPDTISFGGESAGRLVAHIVLRHIDPAAASAELGIAMDPAWTGRGIGTQLLRLTLAEAARRGLRRIELDVASYNERAMRAYRKAGFRETGRRWLSYETPVDFRALLAEPANAWLAPHVRIDTGYMISLVHMCAATPTL